MNTILRWTQVKFMHLCKSYVTNDGSVGITTKSRLQNTRKFAVPVRHVTPVIKIHHKEYPTVQRYLKSSIAYPHKIWIFEYAPHELVWLPNWDNGTLSATLVMEVYTLSFRLDKVIYVNICEGQWVCESPNILSQLTVAFGKPLQLTLGSRHLHLIF